MTDFVNLKIKPAQSFGGAHRGNVCVHVFIWVSSRTCISICVYTMLLKKKDGLDGANALNKQESMNLLGQ
jgi:hypothetical protein